MAPRPESTRLKRGLPASIDDEDSDLSKKPRRSQRFGKDQNQNDPSTPLKTGQLPSPLTHRESTTATEFDGRATTPPQETGVRPNAQFLSPPRHAHSPSQRDTQQTQPFSQFLPPSSMDYEVDDEEGREVWGYLVPQDVGLGQPLVLCKRSACPLPQKPSKVKGRGKVGKDSLVEAEEEFEDSRIQEAPAGGYLVGRHPECDRIIDIPTVSNRHFLIYSESRSGGVIAVLEDLSANGTSVNGQELGRNKRTELTDGALVAISDDATWTFRYPRKRTATGFHQRYEIQQQLGKGHFASVFLCIDRNTGTRYAVKKFEKRAGPGEKSRIEGLQQEIAVLMGISHPNLLCLEDTYDEDDGVYLVLELAAEGELFNWIVMKQKLTEADTRKIFVQLFQALKYLHERNIVHRDIKPENILLTDRQLSVKVADFGLAKIIGEESFTTTLCGTPSYVAPEILQSSSHRRYTRAVDVWSLGVVLYICLCGFPPFSDELYSPQNPFTLAQQILHGRFDYPSPYWDSVGDPALDLIDKMLTVDPDKRITIDECLQHPWTTDTDMEPTQNLSHDSTDSLRGAMEQLDFSRRKPLRERTLLSSLNDVRVSQIIQVEPDKHGHAQPSVKIFEKNKHNPVKPAEKQQLVPDAATKGQNGHAKNGVTKQAKPADGRNPDEFMQTGGLGDQPLMSDDGNSRYASPGAVQQVKQAVENKK